MHFRFDRYGIIRSPAPLLRARPLTPQPRSSHWLGIGAVWGVLSRRGTTSYIANTLGLTGRARNPRRPSHTPRRSIMGRASARRLVFRFKGLGMNPWSGSSAETLVVMQRRNVADSPVDCHKSCLRGVFCPEGCPDMLCRSKAHLLDETRDALHISAS